MLLESAEGVVEGAEIASYGRANDVGEASVERSDAAGTGEAVAYSLIGTGNTTIPFFATGNFESNSDYGINTDYSANSINNQPVQIGASGETWAYYGCYLNIYPTGNPISGKSVQSLLSRTHNCIVALIRVPQQLRRPTH